MRNLFIETLLVVGLLFTACPMKNSNQPTIKPTPESVGPGLLKDFNKEECLKHPVTIHFIVDENPVFRLERSPDAEIIKIYRGNSSQEPINKRVKLDTFDTAFDQLTASGFIQYGDFLPASHGANVAKYRLVLDCYGYTKSVTYDSKTVLDEKFKVAIEQLNDLATPVARNK